MKSSARRRRSEPSQLERRGRGHFTSTTNPVAHRRSPTVLRPMTFGSERVSTARTMGPLKNLLRCPPSYSFRVRRPASTTITGSAKPSSPLATLGCSPTSAFPPPPLGLGSAAGVLRLYRTRPLRTGWGPSRPKTRSSGPERHSTSRWPPCFSSSSVRSSPGSATTGFQPRGTKPTCSEPSTSRLEAFPWRGFWASSISRSRDSTLGGGVAFAANSDDRDSWPRTRPASLTPEEVQQIKGHVLDPGLRHMGLRALSPPCPAARAGLCIPLHLAAADRRARMATSSSPTVIPRGRRSASGRSDPTNGGTSTSP